MHTLKSALISLARFSAAILIVSTISSLPDEPLKAGKTETFPKSFSHGVSVKNLKRARWLKSSPNFLHSSSDVASLRISLKLQTPLNAMRLGWSTGKKELLLLLSQCFGE